MSDKKDTLPNKLIPIKNADKSFHESWDEKRNMLNIPHPYRCVCIGPPNSGKTSTIKNLLIRADPPFEEVFVVHCDPENSKEYDDLDITLLHEIPEVEYWDHDIKKLVILDDLEYKFMPKAQLRILDRLFGYISTHKNLSIILTSQDPFNLPPIIRRCANLWILWKMSDLDSIATVSRRSGLKSYMLGTLFDRFMPEFHDSLWIDMTENTPYKLRKNGFHTIKMS